jgi:hypothetical protein
LPGDIDLQPNEGACAEQGHVYYLGAGINLHKGIIHASCCRHWSHGICIESIVMLAHRHGNGRCYLEIDLSRNISNFLRSGFYLRVRDHNKSPSSIVRVFSLPPNGETFQSTSCVRCSVPGRISLDPGPETDRAGVWGRWCSLWPRLRLSGQAWSWLLLRRARA